MSAMEIAKIVNSIAHAVMAVCSKNSKERRKQKVKIVRIMGKKGRTTIPQEIRSQIKINKGDIISFEKAGSNTIIVRKEKLCTNCVGTKNDKEQAPDKKTEKSSTQNVTLLDFLNRMKISEQKVIYRYLDRKFSDSEEL